MKILMLTPDWKLPWIKTLPVELEKRGHVVSVAQKPPENTHYDVAVHMWAIGSKPGDYADRNVMWVRSYDFYCADLRKMEWDKIDHVVNINKFMFDVTSRYVKHKHSLVYNFVDHSKFTFKERKRGKNIGMACHVHLKKNIPLALQILMKLPEDYELHVAGEIQDPDLAVYLDAIAIAGKRTVSFYGHIPHEHMDYWWDGMNYCLSTSIREGSPNNVIEAMSKGIKPIVHGWPGAKDQFKEVFYTVDEAIEMINGEYLSNHYYDWSVKNFGKGSLDKTIKIIEGAEC